MADKHIDDVPKLAELSGVSRNTIYKLYRRKGVETVRINTLMRLCDALECSLSDLVEYTPDA